MSYYLPISLLKPGETYIEYCLDVDIQIDDDYEPIPVIILENDDNDISVYLLGHWPITEAGKDFILSRFNDIIEKDLIPLDDYRDEDFYEKYGFYDEAIVTYDKYKDNNFTVWSDYVGKIKFKKQ